MRRRQVLFAGLSVCSGALAQAQRTRVARIGFLVNNLAVLRAPFFQPFFSALAKLGWRETVEYTAEGRGSGGDPDRALAMARELVASRVDLLVTTTTAAAVAAKRATDQIPIVSWLGYPVEAGLAQSLARPGGNVTGVTSYASVNVWGKFIELLRELRPGLRELGILWEYAPPAYPDGPIAIAIIERVAVQLGINARIWLTRNEQEVITALTSIRTAPAEALIVTTGGGIHNQGDVPEKIGSLLIDRRLPAIGDLATPAFERAACVLAYAPNVQDSMGRLAGLVDRVLRGANPAEVPFEQPSRFDLVISKKAARAINLVIPQSILLRADRVIE